MTTMQLDKQYQKYDTNRFFISRKSILIFAVVRISEESVLLHKTGWSGEHNGYWVNSSSDKQLRILIQVKISLYPPQYICKRTENY